MIIVTTEVLVHVSASSRPADDARYRREAQEYLHFETACRHSVLDRYDDEPNWEGFITPERCEESSIARHSSVSSSRRQRTGSQSGALATGDGNANGNEIGIATYCPSTREFQDSAQPVPQIHISERASRSLSEVLSESTLAARFIAARHEAAKTLESRTGGAEGETSGCDPPESFSDSFISDAGLAALETPAPRTIPRSSQEIRTALPPEKVPMLSGRPLETPSVTCGLSPFEHTPISITPWSNIPRKKALFSIDVARTPDFPLPRPRTAPSDQTTSVEIESLPPRRTQSESDSWETPSAVIPDSQPSPLSLKRGSQITSDFDSTNTRHEKRLRLQRFSSPVGEHTSRVQVLSSPIPHPVSSPQAQPRIFPSSPARRPRIQNRGGSTRVYRDPSSSAEGSTQIVPSSSQALLTPRSSKQLPLPPSSSNHHQPQPQSYPSPILPLFWSSPPSFQEDSKILAPPPNPSSKPFKTHLTLSLAILATKLPLLRFYTHLQSTQPLRPLRILERGHWTFPTTSFSPTLWDTFWKYLKDFIGAGRASWGVWCVVETCPDLDSKNQDGHNGDDTCKVCKVYCWGEIVPEIWLLLFMASHRQIKGCGAAWIDASGEVIVQMK